MSENSNSESSNFIRNIIKGDIKNKSLVHTRFPPEPNGYLHIGHAKSICLNFGIAKDFIGGLCNLRFDDTNPAKEDPEYTDSIKQDVKWLGFEWDDRLFYASDYFEKLFEFAKKMIMDGKAYVDHLSAEEIREYRGTLTEPGKKSPYRDRSVEENINLFDRMRAGEFEEGECVLRAKIDMSSPNMNMRDPTIYRIKKAAHHRTGNDWCIYPMYDYTHCISDALEGITHSLCTLEFEDHRPLYDWFLEQLPLACHPQQIEFARLNLNYTITSKRKLNELVVDGSVSGWDDPRMPTIVGMRRRGYTAEAIRDFCSRIGITKNDTTIDVGVLENCVREDLGSRAPRVMGVLNPLKVVIENYSEGEFEQLDVPNHPNDSTMGEREVPFSKIIYIEKDDFMEEPSKKFFRLAPGKEVRLRYAYFITCNKVIKDASGNIVQLNCSYDPDTKGGDSADGRKVKGTLHWVSAEHAFKTEVRLYDRLFDDPKPDSNKHQKGWKDLLNKDSIKIVKNAYLEPSLKSANKEQFFQFERIGYFCVDNKDFDEGRPIFNRVVSLRDSWAKKQK
ncbi:MAG: glutamine--tRNA ligase/YqeY domain fusion protein [Gammaproteobacteria bacterium]